MSSSSAGSIRLNGATIANEKTQVPAETRRIGMVFQDYALFPHLSIADNIDFGLRGKSAPARRQRAASVCRHRPRRNQLAP